MAVTNEILDAHPVNCGNCMRMRVQGVRKLRRYAKCVRGHLDDRIFMIDGGNNPLPTSWEMAKYCRTKGEFISMIDPILNPREVLTWTTVGQRHL